ncbi:maleylpyruvate isomerase family mycothiol-dependent enzyme [Streptomyces somaliensis]|uniref:maleylpyruvate isomerase family mycothiol-dependent enzyme n=1 Tax=Streptomyces somaliensis TaxID=78355 RepID=UPI0020CC3943|nr:maleylpyruvate isomerase family mycothiol-dependent enzyme [Streptomyces somaliensis]MCP9945621.1 maleylpyruvate isomerase family mycothiol-dependent enzyme [Streptomyces somaliensis]MCP9961198.1 maleylpyruvate isomerase family mycothiol-dependent enzyme [Streptomyces somaliensis]MCP9973994.1 maleylpyruvate isomerase family mycothiol-dependent enzyme [Streptomyces somaliensis]
MPEPRKRARRYDSAKTRAAVTAQFAHVRDGVARLTEEQLALPTRLGEWTVRELAAHIALVLRSVVRGVAAPEPAARDVVLLDWPAATRGFAAAVDEDTRELAEWAEEAGGLAELYARTADELAGALAAADERLIVTRFGGMPLGDFLVTRTVELTVHTDDLNAATGLDVPHDRQALAACTRVLADALALKAPGGSVELRVPPYAVVQCVEGPRHTRGTPPNVVETDPLTWTRLATGRTSWREALSGARLHASGERADLAPWLPVLG